MPDTTSNPPVGPYTLPPLKFGYADLEPIIDEATMRLHHDKHHQGYVDAVNAALAKHPEWLGQTIEAVLGKLDRVPEDIRVAVRNQGGGHANHQFFWKILTPKAPSGPSGDLASAITRDFGSVDAFKAQFQEAGAKHFGSSWAFLVADPKNDFRLKIVTLPNQDSVVASRPPPGTIARPPRAIHSRPPQHPRSTDPPRSPSKTDAGPPAAPPPDAPEIPASRAMPDPIAASVSPSQPPLPERCDDQLIPPWLPWSL